jgi:sulfatase maturation enzyme AslB (radical SAM superfamily)
MFAKALSFPMSNSISSAFCVIPWIHRHTDEQGFHKLCCIADGPQNDLRNRGGERLHVSQKLTDADVLNSPVMNSTRLKMLRDEWPIACLRCQQTEEAGGESGRQFLNQRFNNGTYEALVAGTASDGTIQNPTVRYSDIRLGNVCNLTCRMCGPIASRLWVPHFNSVQPKAYRIPAEELKVLGQNNWVKHESVGWLLEQSLPHVEALHFAGGEPLILPEMVEALETCVRSGRAGEIELSYNTNMTVLPEKVTSLWHNFKSVSILCSIDGFGRMTEYIRRPSKWSDLDRNLHLLDENFERWKIKWATITCTTQIYNVLNVDQLFHYLRTAGFKHITAIPQLMPLYYPQYLSIQALPASAKSVARERLELEIQRAEALNIPGLAGPIGSIRSTIGFMDEADTTSDLADFLSFCESSDKVFGDSWREAAPELAEQLDANPIPKARGLAALLERFGA